MKSYFLELWDFGNLSLLFFFLSVISQAFVSNLWILLWTTAWFSAWRSFFFWLVPSAHCFPFCPSPSSSSRPHLVCTAQSENPMPHPFQNNLCAAMLNIQAIYTGRGSRDHQRQTLSACWKNTPHYRTIRHYSLWLIILPSVYLLCFCTHWHG